MDNEDITQLILLYIFLASVFIYPNKKFFDA